MIQCLGCFFNPAHRAMLPMITTEEERTPVNSLLDTFTRGVTVLGPIVSAGFINTIGIIHFFTFDALTYLLSALFIYHIQFSEKQTNVKPKKMKDILISIQKFTIWAKNQYTIRTLFMVTV
ncbi:MFS transporter [Paenibacillus dendritiformis]|uniref:MFS transporter n=1 Tax=Paenibacillus dendritiformis TaxID=130049 RepID=UPI0020C4DB0E|nr:MFS transporter [Paenibacillus dendritiformis]CAH8771749.1 hypothetical protein H7S4_004484 [Paenibacillus dendritiformis]